MDVVEKKEKRMIRDIPTLHEFIVKQFIAKTPTKCMTQPAVQRFLKAAQDPNCFRGHADIVQEILDCIIVSGRMTDDACPASIFVNRTFVNLSNSRISGKYVLRLLEFCAPTLVSLDVSGCFQVTVPVLKTVMASCPNLRRLNVKNCRKLTDAFLEDILSFPSLSLLELNVGGNFNITDRGIRNFVTHYPAIHLLENFGVSGLEVHDDTVLLIGAKCTGLRHLQLAYIDVRESTIAELLQAIGRPLESLDISWLSTTSNAKNAQPSAKFIVDVICNNCAMLTELDVTANRNLQLPHVQEIIDRKLSQQYAGAGKSLDTFFVRFIATPRASLEENLKYPNLKLICM